MKSFLRYILFLAATALAAVACSGDSDTDNPNPDPKPNPGPEPTPVVVSLTIVDAPEVAQFELGQTQSWELETEGVVSMLVEAPEGWEASCESDRLTVTAPESKASAVVREGEVLIAYAGEDEDTKFANLPVELQLPADPEISFVLTCSDVTATSAHLNVTPDNDAVGYYFDVCTEAVYEEYQGDMAALFTDYLDELANRYPGVPVSVFLGQLISYGPDSDAVVGLPSETKFYFYAIAVDEEGVPFGEPAIETFETLKAGDPADCGFELSVSDRTTTSVSITAKPTDNSIRYWMGIVAKSDYAGDIPLMAAVKQAIEEVAAEVNMTVSEVVERISYKGEHTEYESGLTANTAYYLYAFAIADTGDSAGDLYKVSFSTLEYDVSDADISLVYRYFDGDALYESDPDAYAKAKGKILVQAKANPNAYATNWYVALAQGDLSDEVTYPDESTIDAVGQSGYPTRSINAFYVPSWDATCTLLGFALDQNGITGVLHREVITLTRDGAAPISEVAPMSAATAVRPLAVARRQAANPQIRLKLSAPLEWQRMHGGRMASRRFE